MTDRKQPTIADYIQAGYPSIFLRTVEPQIAEKKIIEAVEELGQADEVQIGVWKATTGLFMGNVSGGKLKFGNTASAGDLIEALAYIEDKAKDKHSEPIIAIFHNLRQYLDNPGIIQQLIDTIFQARYKGSHIILVGPHLTLPPELRTLVTIVDIPLPTQDQLKDEFEKVVQAYESDLDLPKKKTDRNELLSLAARAAIGLDMIGAENAISLSLATSYKIDIDLITLQKEQEVRKSDVLEFWPVDETIDNVGGYDYYKNWLSRRQKAFSKEARDYGLPYPKGMLIVGPAGTGKSLTAKATSSFLKLPLLRLDMGKVFRSLVGESEAAIRMALRVAEAVSPVVLWLDEVEKGLAGASSSGDLDSGVTARVVSTVLTWRQETSYPVVLVATANDVSNVPSMVYRKGRLDEVWCTDLPLENERAEIFKIHLRKRNRNPGKFDCRSLAKKSPEMTGAEIEGCIEDAMFSAFDADQEVSTRHIVTAINETVPQAKRDVEELDAIREWCAHRARSVSGGEPPQSPTSSKVRSINTKRRRKN